MLGRRVQTLGFSILKVADHNHNELSFLHLFWWWCYRHPLFKPFQSGNLRDADDGHKMDPNGKFQLIFKVGPTPFPHPEAPGRAPQLGNSNGPIIAHSKKRATGYETEMGIFHDFSHFQDLKFANC